MLTETVVAVEIKRAGPLRFNGVLEHVNYSMLPRPVIYWRQEIIVAHRVQVSMF